MLDVTPLTAPKVDQLTADHLVGGPMIGTITGARATHANDKDCIELTLDSFHLPWRPCKTMIRLLASVWGPDASTWPGRTVRLFRDPTVKFGKDTLGGVRINGLSHIPASFEASVTITKGQRKPYRVERLAPTVDPLAPVAEALGVDLPRLEAALTAASGHPIRDRAKAAAWATGKGAEALAAALAPTAAP